MQKYQICRTRYRTLFQTPHHGAGQSLKGSHRLRAEIRGGCLDDFCVAEYLSEPVLVSLRQPGKLPERRREGCLSRGSSEVEV